MAKILIIDDEPQLLSIMERILSVDGHVVQTAENGKVGIRMVQEGQFDLVITDVVMPVQDGLEVILTLSKLANPPKLFVMSGGSRNLDTEYLLSMARVLRVDKVLAKPVDLEVLRAEIREMFP